MNRRKTFIVLLSIAFALALPVVGPTSTFAWTSEQDFLMAATNAIMNKTVVLDDAFGDELLEFAGTCTNASLLQTLSLVNSFRQLSLFESTLSESNLVESISISSNITVLTSMTPDDWHFWAGRLLLAGGLALSSNESASYDILTNALSVGGTTYANNAGTNVVMRSLIDAFEMDDLSCYQAFEALACAAAAISGHSAMATNLAENLPLKYRLMVEEAITGDE